MQGSLQDMHIADLIQHICQDHKTAELVSEHNKDQARLYFKAGNIVHGTLGDIQGEEVVFNVLKWEDGTFVLNADIEAPTVTISRSWSSLLLEGARRLDEVKKTKSNPTKEKKTMATKKKSELLAEALAGLLESSSDIQGAAVVGNDGLTYSVNVPQRDLDENLVGASSAAILSLGKRSVKQLNCGDFNQALIRGEKGNIIVAALDENTLFVGLTGNNVNLGMAFAEVSGMTQALAEIL